MAPRTLITGGAGFVGRHLTRALAAEGDRVRVLDLRQPESTVPGVRYVRGSVTDADLVADLLAGTDRLFHLAARTDLWIPDDEEYLRVNRGGTRLVMRRASAEGVDRVVHVSTEAILRDFGDAGAGVGQPPASLEHVPSPSDMPGPYCRSKALGEREVRAAARGGLDVTVVNPTVPMGPGDPGETPPGRLLMRALNGDLPAYAESRMDVIDVRDLARGIVSAADRGKGGRRYVLGGHRVALGRLLERLEEIGGVPAPSLRVPYVVALMAAAAGELLSDHVTGRRPAASREGVRLSRAAHRFDGARFRRELGLEIRPLRETLSDTVGWLAGHGHVELPSEA